MYGRWGLLMSGSERDRGFLVRQSVEDRLSRSKASERLGISLRALADTHEPDYIEMSRVTSAARRTSARRRSAAIKQIRHRAGHAVGRHPKATPKNYRFISVASAISCNSIPDGKYRP
jgi:hypothetical protein